MPTAIFTPRVVREHHKATGRRRCPIAHHGWFTSFKLGTTIPYRGLQAFDFLCLAEVHPRVAFVSTSTDPIEYWDGACWTQHSPLFAVALKGRMGEVQRYVDVDVLTARQAADQAPLRARIARSAREAGRTFLTFTERQINVEPRRTNAYLVLAYAGDGIAAESDRATIRQISEGTKSFSLNEVVALGVLGYVPAYTAVLNMVFAGELQFALGRPFDGDTRLWRRWR